MVPVPRSKQILEPLKRLAKSLLWGVLLLFVTSSCVADDELEWLHRNPPAAPTTPVSDDTPAARTQPSLQKVGGALAVVLGTFFLVTQFMRKQAHSLPTHDAMEALGAVPITPKVKLHLVRLGTRVLVLHIAGDSVQPVAEVSDPDEVSTLLSASSRAADPSSVDAWLQNFQQGLQQSYPPPSHLSPSASSVRDSRELRGPGDHATGIASSDTRLRGFDR